MAQLFERLRQPGGLDCCNWIGLDLGGWVERRGRHRICADGPSSAALPKSPYPRGKTLAIRIGVTESRSLLTRCVEGCRWPPRPITNVSKLVACAVASVASCLLLDGSA